MSHDVLLCCCAGVLARLLQRRELHDAKMTMKQKRAELLDSMRQMPDYSLQVCLAGWLAGWQQQAEHVSV